VKARDLKPGNIFTLQGEERYKTVLETHYDYFISKTDEHLHCRVSVFHDNRALLVLDGDEEVITKSNTIILPGEFLAPRLEPKSRTDYSFSYMHEEFYFRPSKHLKYWIHWGPYIFDIRDVRKLFGVPLTMQYDLKPNQEVFDMKINDMLSLVEEKPFKEVLLKIHKLNSSIYK